MAKRLFCRREQLLELVSGLGEQLDCPAAIYLIGETSLLYEGWRDLVETLELSPEVAAADRGAFDRELARVSRRLGVEVAVESPAEVIPLPAGAAERARFLGSDRGLELYHFDPYSVCFRAIACGDERDYRLVLTCLEHGWITIAEMDTRLEALLPRFSMATIRQDPAELRRRYKGLVQMWQAAGRAGG